MINEFRKFAGFKVIRWFIENPDTKIHIKELARRLSISPSTSKHYCDLFSDENILMLERVANLCLFRLNNDSVYVKELKKAIFLLILKNKNFEKIAENAVSLTVYGSFASGEYHENSDLDVLVIGKDSEVDRNFAVKLRQMLKREIQLTVIGYPKWEKMKKDNDAFAEEVLNNHILIKGAEL